MSETKVHKYLVEQPNENKGELGEWLQVLSMDDGDSVHVYMRSCHLAGNPDYVSSAMARFVGGSVEFTIVGMTDDALETLGKMCLKFAESMRELQKERVPHE